MTTHYRYNAPHQRYVDAQINARVMKLVDMTDSKSVARNSVPVQVRPLVPFSLNREQADLESVFLCLEKIVSVHPRYPHLNFPVRILNYERVFELLATRLWTNPSNVL